MSDSPDGSDSVGDAGDDEQLTIRIPNPKMYMARQSGWKGRRGKPRWFYPYATIARGPMEESVNTPLCQLPPIAVYQGAIDCDRNLPVCNHCTEDDDPECNYTPKRRHKAPTDQAFIKDAAATMPNGANAASFLVSDLNTGEELLTSDVDGHSFYGQNVAGPSRGGEPLISAAHILEDPHPPKQRRSQRGDVDEAWYNAGSTSGRHSNVSFISHSFTSDHGSIVHKSLIKPWISPEFAPLPAPVLDCIAQVNSVEMPSRPAFEEGLRTFLVELPPELLETAVFAPDTYATLARFVTKGEDSTLSERLRVWIRIHRVQSGSAKSHLLLIPRDAFFHLDNEEMLREEYVARVDDSSSAKGKQSRAPANGHGTEYDLTDTVAFERIPVQSQIYDILVYSHRSHGSSPSMLFEARRIGVACITWPMAEIFIGLCPLCNLRNKSINSQNTKADSASAHAPIGESSHGDATLS
ncbi:hypothetical protein CONPUDRAFT_51660 [Coniophora puteana RWD-64-598 SS2]|uniref:Uncharacterized protein n=1 Tax=Coniophora puteana (strain RWD-64-598) TaxID=741705 RepID=A0A5M3MV53_CONPW|nr:uncharacterized protein CONPUDRAFT_51660 [Coniophora puteana RWD-64-598 SS2]EIW82996.1 hypothetical protein CONPUDRAFT_51660 [Coniophora puteana RWD-64-598 SS2]